MNTNFEGMPASVQIDEDVYTRAHQLAEELSKKGEGLGTIRISETATVLVAQDRNDLDIVLGTTKIENGEIYFIGLGATE